MFGRGKPEESKEEHKEEGGKPQSSTLQSTSKMFSRFVDTGAGFDAKPKIGDEAQGFIDKLLSNVSDFKVLDLTKLEFTIVEKKAIFEALAVNKTVEKSDFSTIDFNEIDAENFENAFKNANNTTLKLLILNYNPIGDKGIERIVKTNLCLDKLVAICCEIGNDGAESVAKYAKIPNVCLNQNYIKELGVQKMLENPLFSKLTFMALAINPIKDATALRRKIDSFSSGEADNQPQAEKSGKGSGLTG